MNSLFNALHISIVVAIGYMLGIFLDDSIISDVRVGTRVLVKLWRKMCKRDGKESRRYTWFYFFNWFR